MDKAEKHREDRLRRVAKRRGFRIEKSRRRDPKALDYGAYRVVKADRIVFSSRQLDAIEAYLNDR